MITLMWLIFVFVLLAFLGYVFHWAFHQRWSKRFYSSHMNHHLKQYPPSDFYSDRYRDPGSDNTAWLFALVFSPFVATIVVLTLISAVSLFLGLAILAEMAVIGWLNNSLHDSFHLRETFWHKFKFFNRLQKLHYQHHVNMRSNLGIFSFLWDKIFRTFNDI